MNTFHNVVCNRDRTVFLLTSCGVTCHYQENKSGATLLIRGQEGVREVTGDQAADLQYALSVVALQGHGETETYALPAVATITENEVVRRLEEQPGAAETALAALQAGPGDPPPAADRW